MRVRVTMENEEGNTFYVENDDGELKLKWCDENYEHDNVTSDKNFLEHIKFAVSKGLTVTITPVNEE